MKKLIVLFLILQSLLIPANALASGENESCPSVYGVNCPSADLGIDKTVKNPKTGEFVDFLSSSSPTFLPGQDVLFRIEVFNDGDADLGKVNVSDKLPEFVEFVQGPGNYDKNTRTLSWSIDNLKKGDSRLFDIKARVKQSKDLPDMGVSCLTNWTQATKDNQSAQDTATFCIQTKILGTTSELPKTGTSNTDLMLVTSLMSLGGATLIYLTRKLKVS